MVERDGEKEGGLVSGQGRALYSSRRKSLANEFSNGTKCTV